MSASFAALLPVVLLIAAGIVLRHTIMREDEQWKGIERLAYYLLFPALIVDMLATSDLSQVPVLGVGGSLFLAIVLMAFICLALRPLMAARFGVDGPAFSSVMQGATRWNTFVALALAGGLFGTPAVALTAVAIVAMIPILNVINVWTHIHYASEGPRNARTIVGALIGNPLIWSCVIGLALNIFGLPLPGPVHSFLDLLARSSLACGLLTVGAGLHIAGLIRPAPAMMIATTLADRDARDSGRSRRADGRHRRRAGGRHLLLIGAGSGRNLCAGAPDGRRRTADGADPDVRDGAGGADNADRARDRSLVVAFMRAAGPAPVGLPL
jgi:malonate transporter and related proteins